MLRGFADVVVSEKQHSEVRGLILDVQAPQRELSLTWLDNNRRIPRQSSRPRVMETPALWTLTSGPVSSSRCDTQGGPVRGLCT